MAKSVTCGCGWSVKSETDDDLVKNVTEHVQSVHKLMPRRELILAQAKSE